MTKSKPIRAFIGLVKCDGRDIGKTAVIGCVLCGKKWKTSIFCIKNKDAELYEKGVARVNAQYADEGILFSKEEYFSSAGDKMASDLLVDRLFCRVNIPTVNVGDNPRHDRIAFYNKW